MRFLIKRIIQGLIVIIGVSIVVFFVMRVIGDPVRRMLPLDARPEDIAQLKAQLGFDRPIPVQFVEFMKDLVRLDFGESLWQRGIPARDLVLDRLPATFLLVFAGMAVAVLISVPLGMVAAMKPGSWTDRIAVSSSLVGLSLPQFWLGILFILIFAVQLGWLPTSGRGGLTHLVLPAMTIALPAAGRMTQMVRSSMLDELNKQYVVTAQAKGMSFGYILFRHTLRNVMVPVTTIVGWETIRALAGYTVVVETVFAWPGIGYLAMQAIKRQDVILLQATVFTAALLVVVINILVDMLYTRIDPRIKLG